MTSNRPSGRPSSGAPVPPTSRRSARQQRLAHREANRALARASTRGSSGGGSIMLYTIVAVVAAVVIVAGALILTNQSKATGVLGSPNPPVGSAVTPVSIPTKDRTLGNATAPHTLDIYEDFQCPNCEIFTRDFEPEVVANYVATGKVKLVYHDYLVVDSNTGGTESLDAANAALCANDQGLFWPYHDWLFANQYTEGSGAFTKDRLKSIGAMVPIPDIAKFNSCVDGGSHNQEVKTEQSSTPSDVRGTPALKIDGGNVLTSYDYVTISAALDKALGVTPSPAVSASASVAPSVSAAPSASPAPSSAPSASPS
jgi:protein-disulfide isomerase